MTAPPREPDADRPPADGPATPAVPPPGSTKVVGWVAGVAVVLVVVIGVVMAVALRGGASRGDADGLADDVSAFTTVVLSSRPPERAYDHLSAECRQEIPFEEFEAAVTAARADLEAELGIDLGRLAVAEVATRAVSDGGGEASVTLEEIGLDEIPVGDPFPVAGWSRWAYESGLWRAVDCDRPADLVPLDP